MRAKNVPVRWYGALVLPGGRFQCVEAQTLPRGQSLIDGVPVGTRESTWELMTDPVRASWPSR